MRKAVIIIAVLLAIVPFLGLPTMAQQTPPASPPLPPVAIKLTAIPSSIPPGGSGVVIVQLVDSAGNPAPARSQVQVFLFSSDTAVATVQGQLTIPFGKSHGEANVQTHLGGSAVITAIANGYESGSAVISSSEFRDFQLRVSALNSIASPGDSVLVRVDLLASNKSFITPVSVPVMLATNDPEIPLQTVQVQAGSSFAYTSLKIPSDTNVTKTPFISIGAAAQGFTSATGSIILSKPSTKSPASTIIWVPGPLISSEAGTTTQYLSTSLFDNNSILTRSSTTVYFFSSNTTVLSVPTSITFSGNDSMPVPVVAGAPGSAQISAIAQGVLLASARVTVVNPVKPSILASFPQFIRVGEQYSFSVGFYYDSQPAPIGGATIYTASSSPDVSSTPSVQTNSFGYAIGSISASKAATSNITLVLNGVRAGSFTVSGILSPSVAQVQYSVLVLSRSGPLFGLNVNFIYLGNVYPEQTDQSGKASFTAYNDSAVLVSVPPVFTANNRTYFFTGWSNSQKNTTIQLFTSSTLSITAQYFKVIAPVSYSVSLVSRSGSIQNAVVNFTYNKKTVSKITDSQGVATFLTYNDSAVSITVPKVVKENNRTYFFTGWSNSQKNSSISVLSSSPTFSIQAQYFKSVVPTQYTFYVLADNNKPVAGLSFNVTTSTGNFTLTTGANGTARFLWYNNTAFSVLMPTLFQPSSETRYAFISLVNQTKTGITINAPGPIQIVARYGTYYLVTVVSPLGTVTGSGWYRYGSPASFSVAPTTVGGPLISQRFAGWVGAITSSQPSGSLIVTGPATITAEWVTDESLLFIALGIALAFGLSVGIFVFRFRKRGQVQQA